jgi:hypothetical protein
MDGEVIGWYWLGIGQVLGDDIEEGGTSCHCHC